MQACPEATRFTLVSRVSGRGGRREGGQGLKILGIGGSAHDYAAALTVDGRTVCAVEEERLARVKHCIGLPWKGTLGLSARYCLDVGGLGFDDLDLLVTNSALLGKEFFAPGRNYEIISHHLAHAASAFYPSGFEDAAILVVDAWGSLENGGAETITYAVGEGNRIRVLQKVLGELIREEDELFATDSLGCYYSLATLVCGFAPLEEGKTMGLAPYSNEPLPEVYDSVTLLSNGGVGVSQEALQRFEAFGHKYVNLAAGKDDQFRREARVAHSAQAALEDALIHCVRHVLKLTDKKRLCLAGGVALNSVANGRLSRELGLEDLFIQPAAGDAGTALGAALYGEYAIGGAKRGPEEARATKMKYAYTGRSYGSKEIEEAIDKAGLNYVTSSNPARAAAEALARGRIVGWFTGGSEYGPRALGHRSIVADPRPSGMKDALNARVKHREWFRPFAPSALLDEQGRYFDNDRESPFMLLVCDVRPEARDLLPAITHVDGTARLQTVERDSGNAYSRLIEEFGAITGVPVILNTSFNDRGEPIVETPTDAIRTFLKTGMDLLVMEEFVIGKG